MKKIFLKVILAFMTVPIYTQTIAKHSFESSGDSWNPITLSNEICNSGNSIWDFTTNLNGMNPTDGNLFWGISDLTGSCTIGRNASLKLPDVLVASFSNVTFSFDYFASNFDKNEELKYELFFDGISQGNVIIIDGEPGNSDDTNGWKTETVSVPNNVQYVSVILFLKVKNKTKLAEIAGFDNIKLSGISNLPTCDFITVWENNTWSNGLPDARTSVAFKSDYDTETWGSLEACDCEINQGAKVIINPHNFLKIQNNLTVSGSLEILDQGSLLMTNDLANVAVSGNLNVHKTSSPIKKYDYIYWSSPTKDETIGNALSSSVLSRIYEFNTSVFNKNTSGWQAVNGGTKMNPGTGYIAMGPISGNFPLTQSVTFEGPVNNGIVQTPIVLSADISDNSDDWNLIGNPYPSAINADHLLNDPLNKNLVSGTVHIWTHNTERDDTKETNKYTSDDYATYTVGTGGVAAVSGGVKPTGLITSGQSFFVEALTPGVLTFNNSMRMIPAESTEQLFKESVTKNAKSEKDRIWLNMTNREGAFNQLLVGFIDGASDDIDNYDGLKFGGGFISFYSIIEEKEFAVNGRAPLSQNENIKLGFSSYLEEGDTLKISKATLEGKLNSSEYEILLKDKDLNLVHDLNKKDYEFYINDQGIFNDRFELIINKTIEENVLNNTTLNKLKIINTNDELIISTLNNDIISNFTAFDYMGKVLISNKAKEKRFVISKEKFNTGTVLIINAELENNESLSTKLLLMN